MKFIITYLIEPAHRRTTSEHGYVTLETEHHQDAVAFGSRKFGAKFGVVYKAESEPLIAAAQKPEGEYAIVKHAGKMFTLNYSSTGEEDEIESFGDSVQVGANIYWCYRVAGSHEGWPINIAVKNPRYEPDEDSYIVTDDGFYWADALDEKLADEVEHCYVDLIQGAIEEDVKQ